MIQKLKFLIITKYWALLEVLSTYIEEENHT